MADDSKKTEIDIETLSDEDFMKLPTPEAVTEEDEDKENDDDANSDADTDAAATDAAAKAAGGGDGSEDAGTSTGEDDQTGDGTDGAGDGEDGEGTGGTEESELTDEEKVAEAEKLKGANDDKETLKLKDKDEAKETSEGETDEEKAAAKTIKSEKESQELTRAQETATTFYEKVSAPFRADGKDVQVRTPEEAIKLMQMGVNYSRRMEEMKPLRAMDAMLTEHGVNTPEKLNELIDLSKGGKEAIQKHLAKHNIDPLDLDTSKADAHTTPNYQSDPKNIAFQEAIDNTLLAEGGKELLNDVNRDWDVESKEALRDNPSIFGKLLEQKDTGVYDQIQKELLHQRTMGYLAGVPFLQAYEQVGNAMQKAGVFDEKEVQKKGLAPIHSGSRKSALKSKTEQTNPNLSSSNQSRKATSQDVASSEPDYLSMSDEDFMKLAQPT